MKALQWYFAVMLLGAFVIFTSCDAPLTDMLRELAESAESTVPHADDLEGPTDPDVEPILQIILSIHGLPLGAYRTPAVAVVQNTGGDTIEVTGDTVESALTGLPAGTYAISFSQQRRIGAVVDTVLLPDQPFVTVSLNETNPAPEVTVTYTRRPGSGMLWLSAYEDSRLVGYDEADLELGGGALMPSVDLFVEESPGLSHGPEEIVLGPEGSLWVVARNTARIIAFTADQLVPVSNPLLDTPDPAAMFISPLLEAPVGLAVTPGGDGYVTSLPSTPGNDVLILLPNLMNNPLPQTSGPVSFPGEALTSTLVGLADAYTARFAPNGDLWVANTEPTNAANVARFSAAQLAGAAGNLGPPDTIIDFDSSRRPAALAFDASGSLWVGAWESNELFRFDNPASLGSTAGDFDADHAYLLWEDPGQTIEITVGGFAFDNSGDLWISDSSSEQIVRFAATELTTAPGPLPTLLSAQFVYTGIPEANDLGFLAFNPPPPGLFLWDPDAPPVD